MYRPTYAEIDLDAVRFNLGQVRSLVGPGVMICPAVKANGYGHGAVEVSRAALGAGADMLAVATLEEAVELKDAGIPAPVLLLGCLFPDQASDVIEYDVTSMVCDLSYASELSRTAISAGRRARVHVKVDTGMGRVGVQVLETLEFVSALSRMPGIEIEGIFTHFPSADDDPDFTEAQAREFGDVCDAVSSAGFRIPIRHAANSAAILTMPGTHFDMVRPGIMVYGLYDSDQSLRSVDLRQSMTLKTRVAFMKELPAGRTVSYGRTFCATRPTRVATLPIGYADGYNRLLSNRAPALVHGRRVPVIGRVCMDQIMVDVTEVPGAAVGDEVVLYGRQGVGMIRIEEIAGLLGTISYEVVCALSKRVPRVHVRLQTADCSLQP